MLSWVFQMAHILENAYKNERYALRVKYVTIKIIEENIY